MRGNVATSTRPGDDIVAVTKHDSDADPNGPFRALIMDAEGDIKLHMSDGTDRSLPSGLLAAQVVYPLTFSRVWSTGTDGQNIYGIK